MNPQLLTYEQGINQVVAKIHSGIYSNADVSRLRIYINGYNQHVKWLATQPNGKVYSEIKSEDFGIFYKENAIYLKFIKEQ